MKRQKTLFDCGVVKRRCVDELFLNDSWSSTDTHPSDSESVNVPAINTPAGAAGLAHDCSTPIDIAPNSQHPPSQPIIKYPTTVVGGKNRSFWYMKFNWLEYSILKDAGFCYPCRLFSTNDGRLHNTFITSSGFRNWKHATGKDGILTQHDRCQWRIQGWARQGLAHPILIYPINLFIIIFINNNYY